MPLDQRFRPLMERLYFLSCVGIQERKDHIVATFPYSDWGHIDPNPFQVADNLNRFMIQMGVYERGSLRVSVPMDDLNGISLTLIFPLRVSENGDDDPDVISLFDFSKLTIS